MTQLEKDILKAAQLSHGGWRPWLGADYAARNLTINGFLKEAGISVMPPHTLYVITEAGEKTLAVMKD